MADGRTEPRRKRRRIELRKTLIVLPSLITLSSIFCGFYAMVLASRASRALPQAALLSPDGAALLFGSAPDGAAPQPDDALYRAAVLIVFAMFFDMLDGRVARATKTQSAFGLQIDSLADVVSFGAAPALLIYHWTLWQTGGIGLAACFVFVACGAVRLARFNLLSMGASLAPHKPGKYIVGLPIPGAAGILVALVVANHATGGELGAPHYAPAILAATLGLAVLMVSTVRFRSFKEVRLNATTVMLVGLALASSIAIHMHYGPAFVLLWLLGCYLLIGMVESLWQLCCLDRRLTAPISRWLRSRKAERTSLDP